MNEYTAPISDMRFILREIAPLEEIARLPAFADLTFDVAEAILVEAGKFASNVLSPLNARGDREGARLQDGAVLTAAGWRDAYRRFTSAGWASLSSSPANGGQGMPRLVSCLVDEMWSGANLSFALCPLLSRGATEAIELCASQELRRIYLDRLVSGEWAGTMVLTEPGAGSDLAGVSTRAIPASDGSYRLHGQKIFITYGDHDLTPNIVHLVLARLPGAPEGVKGISLFLVPKILVRDDGSLGRPNDLRCASLEHKLGIHASPTAVLSFGEEDGAVGWLVGQEHRGLEHMFLMMNAARFAVGVQGIGLSERAYQRAAAYARERLQGQEVGSRSRARVPILRHPDVRRMLMLIRSRTEAMRALACVVAAAMDVAHGHADAHRRREAQGLADLLNPVVKGWSSETAVDNTSLALQVHGGMGFVEETGAAQYWRDARITTIYEGTTGIQAADLVGRKIARDAGESLAAVIRSMGGVRDELTAASSPSLRAMAEPLRDGISSLEQAAGFILAEFRADPRRPLVGSVPFLELLGIVAGGWQMSRAALAAERGLAGGQIDVRFHRRKLATAHFYADHVLTRAPGLAQAVVRGAGAPLALEDDDF